AANPVTGTSSMSVPVFTTPGRSNFSPEFSLSYDSGSGNGPFGFGWNLSLPSITRKTDKGLPEYQDAEESDVFILSGAEDLVPLLFEENGEWRRFTQDSPTHAPGYRMFPRLNERGSIEAASAPSARTSTTEGRTSTRSPCKCEDLGGTLSIRARRRTPVGEATG
ncbi:MAG TPA: SpvB/TcaC N-terminal domain-containing protein, partial [Pyrinomonadaceae bacterium]|nr:SpvB/TcaC N-terminal domain-containing protein [Pyrinomonadaceae bacterium]